MALSSGLVYTLLFILAVKILRDSPTGTTSDAHKTTTGRVRMACRRLDRRHRGAVFIGAGLYQGYRALSQDFLEDSKTEEMSPAVRHWHGRLGSLGYASRMVVSCLVGVFLVKAALEYDPKAAVGIDGVLAKLSHQSYGHFLLGVVAAGLIAFGVYSIMDARYRRICSVRPWAGRPISA